MKILFAFLTEKKKQFWTVKKFVYLIFINKLSWYHPNNVRKYCTKGHEQVSIQGKLRTKNVPSKDMSALCIEFLSRLLGVIQNVNRSWQERCFFLHSQKINPPGIYEGNSPEIFDAVTFSKVCEQAGCNSLGFGLLACS